MKYLNNHYKSYGVFVFTHIPMESYYQSHSNMTNLINKIKVKILYTKHQQDAKK